VDPVCRQENARFNKRGDGPGSRNDASSHLTAGTRCGNSAKRRLRGLYIASFGRPVPWPQLRQAVTTQ
jgi:hypothetical protein